jgi:hypothetical protein
VGVPIRLADPTALKLVRPANRGLVQAGDRGPGRPGNRGPGRPGNRIDLLRIDDANGRPTAVADGTLLLRVTNADDLATGSLLLALSPQEAGQAVAACRQGFAIAIRPD